MGFIAALIGYAFGNFQTAFIVGRVLGVKDIREHGSGNAGATNVVRVLGWRAGAITFVADFFKAFLAILFTTWLLGNQISGGYRPEIAIYAGLGAVIGHNWPAALKFKGGKGIASTMGALAGVYWPSAIIFAIILFGTIAITRYVSLGSLLGAVSIPIVFYLGNRSSGVDMAFAFIIAGLAIFKHRANIERLLKGEEKKLGRGQKEKY